MSEPHKTPEPAAAGRTEDDGDDVVEIDTRRCIEAIQGGIEFHPPPPSDDGGDDPSGAASSSDHNPSLANLLGIPSSRRINLMSSAGAMFSVLQGASKFIKEEFERNVTGVHVTRCEDLSIQQVLVTEPTRDVNGRLTINMVVGCLPEQRDLLQNKISQIFENPQTRGPNVELWKCSAAVLLNRVLSFLRLVANETSILWTSDVADAADDAEDLKTPIFKEDSSFFKKMMQNIMHDMRRLLQLRASVAETFAPFFETGKLPGQITIVDLFNCNSGSIMTAVLVVTAMFKAGASPKMVNTFLDIMWIISGSKDLMVMKQKKSNVRFGVECFFMVAHNDIVLANSSSEQEKGDAPFSVDLMNITGVLFGPTQNSLADLDLAENGVNAKTFSIVCRTGGFMNALTQFVISIVMIVARRNDLHEPQNIKVWDSFVTTLFKQIFVGISGSSLIEIFFPWTMIEVAKAKPNGDPLNKTKETKEKEKEEKKEEKEKKKKKKNTPDFPKVFGPILMAVWSRSLELNIPGSVMQRFSVAATQSAGLDSEGMLLHLMTLLVIYVVRPAPQTTGLNGEEGSPPSVVERVVEFLEKRWEEICPELASSLIKSQQENAAKKALDEALLQWAQDSSGPKPKPSAEDFEKELPLVTCNSIVLFPSSSSDLTVEELCMGATVAGKAMKQLLEHPGLLEFVRDKLSKMFKDVFENLPSVMQDMITHVVLLIVSEIQFNGLDRAGSDRPLTALQAAMSQNSKSFQRDSSSSAHTRYEIVELPQNPKDPRNPEVLEKVQAPQGSVRAAQPRKITVFANVPDKERDPGDEEYDPNCEEDEQSESKDIDSGSEDGSEDGSLYEPSEFEEAEEEEEEEAEENNDKSNSPVAAAAAAAAADSSSSSLGKRRFETMEAGIALPTLRDVQNADLVKYAVKKSAKACAAGKPFQQVGETLRLKRTMAFQQMDAQKKAKMEKAMGKQPSDNESSDDSDSDSESETESVAKKANAAAAAQDAKADLIAKEIDEANSSDDEEEEDVMEVYKHHL